MIQLFRSLVLAALLINATSATANDAKPHVVSINVCADQLVMALADASQVLSLSFLSLDPAASVYHEKANAYSNNRGVAEEVLALQPDVVIAGQFTNRYTLDLLKSTGVRVETLAIADSVDDVLSNIENVGGWLHQEDRATTMIRSLRLRLKDLPEISEPRPTAAIYDPRGYTVGGATLRGDILEQAGWHNVAADRGIEHYGSLSLETLLKLAPSVLIASPYSADTWSRAQALNRHPALSQQRLGADVIQVPSSHTLCGGPWTLDVIEQLASARLQYQSAR